MENDIIFSWALDADGEWKHVDDVPRGLACNCVCPHCNERLKACQGEHPELRSHGFSHHSKTRRANLKICYYVSLYKRAESIIKEKGCVHAPSYFGIFRDIDLKFKKDSIRIDNEFEREDKQPDVIATSVDGEQYLIEFVFNCKVQHKKPIDYKNLTCLEINLSKQTFETLEDFLLHSKEDRQWLNNENYFNRVEETYRKENKSVRLVPEEECQQCELKSLCVAVKNKDKTGPLFIENSGNQYRLCKTEEYKVKLEEKRIEEEREEERRRQELELNLRRMAEERNRAEIEERKKKEEERIEEEKREAERRRQAQELEMANLRRMAEEQNRAEIEERKKRDWERKHRFNELKKQNAPQSPVIIDEEPSCFNCRSNLSWGNIDELARCGAYISLGIKMMNNPDVAKNCRLYKHK